MTFSPDPSDKSLSKVSQGVLSKMLRIWEKWPRKYNLRFFVRLLLFLCCLFIGVSLHSDSSHGHNSLLPTPRFFFSWAVIGSEVEGSELVTMSKWGEYTITFHFRIGLPVRERFSVLASVTCARISPLSSHGSVQRWIDRSSVFSNLCSPCTCGDHVWREDGGGGGSGRTSLVALERLELR